MNTIGSQSVDVAAASEASPAVAPVVTSAPTAPDPTTSAAPRVRAVVHHAAPAPARRPAPRFSQAGGASWYGAPKGTCAHQTLPFGTVVTITDLATGQSTTCTVEDRGPYVAGRIIDLAPDVFAKLAPTSAGVISVEISWS